MDLFPLSHVGALLGVDPKTLRLWLLEAGLTAIAHPDDARQKCLSLTQIQQVADTHGRRLPPAFLSSAAPPPSLPPPDVLSQLAQMQQQIFTLQEQVTRLSLALLHLSSARPSPLLAPPIASAPAPTVVPLPPVPDAPPRPRPPSRAVPMIAFTVDGCYHVVDPDKGILPLTPDSPQWFAWLASTNTLTFQGRHGSFTASRRFRRGKRVQSWTVSRCLHSRSCTLYAGMTMTLTTARLEGLAQQLLTRLAPL
jgi:hypothetical protein